MNKQQLKEKAFAAVDANAERIREIGEWVWQNPESGYKEFKTAKYTADILRELGLNVRENLAVTGVRGDFDTGKCGPTIAVLGEMDSLILPGHCCADPETGAAHACGHHASMAAMLGAAMALKSAGVADELAGKIAFLAVPAEECIEIDFRLALMEQGKIGALGGKGELIRCGAFDDVDIACMLHASAAACGYGPHNGFITKKLIFKGKSCHAATPQNGINALHAATLAQNAVGLLRERWAAANPTFRVHGVVTSGGDVVNIIPGTVTMEYLVRADKIESLLMYNREFDRAVQGAASSFGAGVEIITKAGYMPQYDDCGMEKMYDDAVKLLVPEAKNSGSFFHYGSTDMGELSTIMPTLHGYIPGMKGTSHGVDYVPANPESLYIKSAKVLLSIIIDLLADDAAAAREVAARREGKLSIKEYIALTDSLNSVSETPKADK